MKKTDYDEIKKEKKKKDKEKKNIYIREDITREYYTGELNETE